MKIKELSKSALLILAVLMAGCGEGEKKVENASKNKAIVETKTVEPTSPIVAPSKDDNEKNEEVDSKSTAKITGKDKVANSDCLSCHMVDRVVIGPSFQDIAAEYANDDKNVAMLVNKVIKGGSGVWGETAMPPHATLSEEDAKEMVEYILSQK